MLRCLRLIGVTPGRLVSVGFRTPKSCAGLPWLRGDPPSGGRLACNMLLLIVVSMQELRSAHQQDGHLALSGAVPW